MIDFDPEIFAKLGGAVVLALPIALDRERTQRTAGLRTFPLVSVTACGFLLVGLRFLEESPAENARLMQGLIGGLGLLRGGAILNHRGSVRGMATAASIWSAGAIGMSAAYGRWEVGITLSLIGFLTLRLGRKIKEKVDHDGGDEDDRKEAD